MKFDLTKTTETLKLTLDKKGINVIVPCQVKMAFDVSGSFMPEHNQGKTQELINRLAPFSLIFDKDKELESYVFSHNHEKLDPITETNLENYVNNYILRSRHTHGGTEYLPVIKSMFKDCSESTVEQEVEGGFFKKLFGKKETITIHNQNEKQLIFFVTDGESTDQYETKKFIDSSINSNTFIVFISLDSKPFKFFETNYANTNYSSYLHMNKSDLANLQNASDSDLYDKLVSPQMTKWMNTPI